MPYFSLTNSRIALGINLQPTTIYNVIYDQGQTLQFYKECFENQFINATEKYYHSEVLKIDTSDSITEYLKRVRILRITSSQQAKFLIHNILIQVEQCLDGERRIKSYLHASTQELLIEKCTDILIKPKLSAIMNECKILVQGENNNHDIARLYKVVSYVPNYDSEVERIAKEHVSAEIQRVASTTRNVEVIFNLYMKFSKLVGEAFNGKQELTTAIHKVSSDSNVSSLCVLESLLFK
ncbi:unnamed protein product [Didymodactylos carnosus]|uniref:Cullin N-terminal domain-containing protein n=1 Tax=Didymodactylos carnosus TaxID=1234261 RepID=A0A815QAC3_9BILA|nr:unnamed protein product [Didymodactylos carnosus]CAF1460627.1 unnamed protein product [Didymodactylos carnosus]CAF4121927.1 unnamed protein product [Didymodactylos carnosus]CAF4330987.1 unnamed protein product [Didymodactylos carnosus]